MSPREKGRALRAAGWKPNSHAGTISWSDPDDPLRGGIDTSAAYGEYLARIAKRKELLARVERRRSRG